MQNESGVVTSAAGASSTSTRVGNVDVLRAGAALLVLVGHSYVLGGRGVPINAEHWYDVPLMFTSTGVWLFFAISGYVITRPFIDRLLRGEPAPALAPYALKRATRIFPLYWLTVSIVIFTYGTDTSAPWQYPLHYALLNNLVPGREASLFSVAWTLTLEVLFYIAVPLLAMVAYRAWKGRATANQLATAVLVSWIASVAFTIGGDLLGPGTNGLWVRRLLPAVWGMFCPGILLAIASASPAASRWHASLEVVRRRTGIAVFTAITALTIGSVFGALTPREWGARRYLVIADLSRPLFAVGYGLLLAVALTTRPWADRVGSWILRLGLVSYGIYLFHGVVLYGFITGAGRDLVPLPHGGWPAYLVHVAVVLGLAIPLAFASWRWFEQPLIRWAANVEWVRRAGAPGPRDGARPDATNLSPPATPTVGATNAPYARGSGAR